MQALGGAAPVVVLGAGAVLVLLVDLLLEGRERLLRALTLVVLGLAAAAALGISGAAFSHAVVLDPLARVAALVAVAGAAVAVSLPPPVRWGGRWSAYLALTLWAAAGMALAAAAQNLIVLFLGIEVLSLGLYVLTAFSLSDGRGAEAAVKYFVLGGLGSGLLLMGSALSYAGRGSLVLASEPAWTGLLTSTGLALIVAGLGFKLALTPFQLWTADVYEGAPTPITAFMAVGTKAAAFAALARLVMVAFPGRLGWINLLAVLGLISMFVGYLLALRQPGLKRLLAFSGIANAGTLVLALLAGPWHAVAFLYLAAYSAASLGAFAVVAAVESAGGDMDSLRGLGRRHPWLSAALVVSLLSLASVPPTGGFLAKLLLLEGLAQAGYPLVAVLVIVGAVLALYPYFKLVVAVLSPAPEESCADLTQVPMAGLGIVAGLAVVATLALGILPGPVLHG